MTKTFDPTKPVQLRDGRAARILATDLKSSCRISIVVAVADPTTGNEHLMTFYNNGRFMSTTTESTHDLVNLPETVVSYVNVYERPPLIGSAGTLSDAKHFRAKDSLGIVKISMEKGNINSLKVEVME